MWAVCPFCRSKTVLFDDQAECSGVWMKCKRGCGMVFELVIHDGKQIFSEQADEPKVSL